MPTNSAWPAAFLDSYLDLGFHAIAKSDYVQFPQELLLDLVACRSMSGQYSWSLDS